MQPKLIAEIGTLYAGTTEVLARALWQNGKGKIHSADPYGGERCPQIIAQWPSELQHHVEFHAKSSMDFFARMILESKTFDLVLVDGNHDYEFALFDLQMASRLLRPGGIVVMDNAEQVGPFKATSEFLEDNPAWRELGDAIATSNPLRPFDRNRASLPGTSFLVLQAPNFYSIGAGPHSWGQTWIDVPRVSGMRLNIVAPTKGILFYQIHLRGFANGNRWVKEERLEGSARIDAQESEVSIDHRFNQAMVVTAPPEFNDALFTLELDLAWRADPGEPPLALATLPSPIDQ
jgi:SAM-dependent methyltransferase